MFSQWKLHHSCLTGWYKGLRKYWNLQSETKVEEIITIVKKRSVLVLILVSDLFKP